MWHPDAGWQALSEGRSHARSWRASLRGEPVIVKRLERPAPDESPLLSSLDFSGYWRREADVALAPDVVDGPGLHPVEFLRVDEDEHGITIWSRLVERGILPASAIAAALGAFASNDEAAPAWASRHLLADRLTMVEERGGWLALERTPFADVADQMWVRRRHVLGLLAEGPQGRLHGDATPSNFLAPHPRGVIAVDWSAFGWGPVGTDLGYFALAARAGLDDLLPDYVAGTNADPHAVAFAARAMAAYTVVTRADWALARVVKGEGALAGKFGHPAVAPHLRALQDQFPTIEAVLSR